MSAPHKHAEAIKAWADGEQIEGRQVIGRGAWHVLSKPRWIESWEYRVRDEHQEFKEAFAAGKTIQLRVVGYEADGGGAVNWVDVNPVALRDPSWWPNLKTPPTGGGRWELRVKPEPVVEKKVVRPHSLVWIEQGAAPSINVKPAPFLMPAIDLEISYDRDSGRVIDVQLKGWAQ